MFGLFHRNSNEKTLSEKGLLGVLEYSNKSSGHVVQLADMNRISAHNLMTFGSYLGDDLTDVTQKMGHLLVEWSNVLIEFSDAINQYRETLKSISLKEAILQPGRDRKRKLKDNIESLQNSLSSLDKVNAYKEQLEELEKFTELDEIEMSNFKRIATREALYLLLNGMHAMASKTDIISTFGKYIVDELDVKPIKVGQEREEYLVTEKTKRIKEDAIRAIAEWHPDKAKVRRTLTAHHGHNPLISKQLPPAPDNNNNSSSNTSPSPSATISTTSSSSKRSNNEEEHNVPDRTVSLTEQNKQYSFYKPDEIVVVATVEEKNDEEKIDIQLPITMMPTTTYQPQLSPSTSNTTTQQAYDSGGGGGFSDLYLFQTPNYHFQQHTLNQQNLYQFYQNYLPPRSYDDVASMFSPGAVFQGHNNNNNNNEQSKNKHYDVGGFVLPFTNPNFHLGPSTSTQSLSSSKSEKSNNEHE
ncbi:Eisosome component PIL1-domain-containing protein [Cokeromyces recurvatus]|uniref:Eisosome component PIL1-domain-containing protein n=1 Tax=Cokeromyces recurvatus TaxID=90255 RepID=UPI00221E6775|nr:Eisosome component PIL1-domain-containing protein [Cokeromyces recurvatus]KAI7907739.1 Eisosome component PIL1-domain-containing protein [Cokeromyces recurvatus]